MKLQNAKHTLDMVLCSNWPIMAIKQDMTVNNQGHIFQSGDKTTTCIFYSVARPWQYTGLEQTPLFSMQITEYYIDCLICLKSIWSSHFRFGGGCDTIPQKCPSISVKAFGSPLRLLRVWSHLSLYKNKIFVCTIVWLTCLHLSICVHLIPLGHLWGAQRAEEGENLWRKIKCVHASVSSQWKVWCVWP